MKRNKLLQGLSSSPYIANPLLKITLQRCSKATLETRFSLPDS
jgi:hypothetical protein